MCGFPGVNGFEISDNIADSYATGNPGVIEFWEVQRGSVTVCSVIRVEIFHKFGWSLPLLSMNIAFV